MWGMLSPTWRRTCPTETLGNILFCSSLQQFLRKVDGVRTTVKIRYLLKLFQVVCPILAGGASASTSFVRRSHGAEQHSRTLSDSPAHSRASGRLKP